jgi:superfamily I DNA/RNA helicase
VGRAWLCLPCARTVAAGGTVAPEAEAAPAGSSKPDWLAAFRPSTYQAAVKTAMDGLRQHLIIVAVAGSGKTRTLEWLLYVVVKAVLGVVAFVAFNRSIKRELADRLRNHPARPHISTIHSAGLTLCCEPAWQSSATGRQANRRLQVKFKLAETVADEMWPTRDERVPARERRENTALHGPVTKLVSLARQNLSTWRDDDLAWLVERHAIELNGAAESLPTVFERTRELRDALVSAFWNQGLVDGAGMIWLPYHLDLAPSRTFRTVFVDEVQDLSRARVKLALRLAGKTGRIVAVGDPAQAIYGFAGADTESIPNLKAELAATSRGVKVLSLDICYRCPKAVVRYVRAMGLHSTIEAAPDAAEGEVRSVGDGWLDAVKRTDNALALCRTNAPLVSPCFRLIRRGIPARIEGREIGSGLLALARKCSWKRDRATDGSAPVLAMLSRLREYVEKQSAKLRAAGHDAQVEHLSDRAECIVALCDGVDTLAQLEAKIRDVFADDGDHAVVFSTVHKAKGLEAADVYILRPDLLPGPWATQAWEVQQERNLMYVAFTRPKARLLFVGEMPEPQGSGEDLVASAEDDTPRPAPAVAPEPQAEPEPQAAPAAKGRKRDLPILPSKGKRGAVEATLAEWEDLRDRYQAAGLRAELRDDIGKGTRFAWKQLALVVGTEEGPVVRCSTTIDVRTRRARETGANAIDVVRVETADGPPLKGSKRKVLRTLNWQGRVCQRVNAILLDTGAAE